METMIDQPSVDKSFGDLVEQSPKLTEPKVILIDEDQSYGLGLKATCCIKSGDLITLYGTSTDNIRTGTMGLYVGGSFVNGDCDASNIYALGQFANDNAYTPEIDEYINQGQIHEAYTTYNSNSIANNNASLNVINEPKLISTRDISVGETIYAEYGLSYWINTKLIKNELDLSHVDKFNEYALKLDTTNLMITYDPKMERLYNVVICANVKDISLKQIVLIDTNKEILTDGEAFGILCNKFQIHQMYTLITELPECIRTSAYDTLLYWDLTFNRIHPQNKIVVDELFKSEQYDEAYKYYCEIDYLAMLSKFVSKENFIKYYTYFTNLYTKLYQDGRFSVE